MIVQMGGIGETGALNEPARVLVVDDDERLLRVIVETLRTEGYDVSATASGLAALELAEQRAPLDLLVTDVCMPEISGHELASRLRARFSVLPVLLVSGSPVEKRKASEQETFDLHTRFLAKPFSLEELLDQVDELTGRA